MCIVTCTLLLSWGYSASAQQLNSGTPTKQNTEGKTEATLRFKKISVEEGLSQSTVFCIIKDRQGFMWFGTRGGGLNKYDGYNFTVYKNAPNDSTSLSNNEVISLFEDSKGRLWVGTRKGGLNLFNPISETFSHFNTSSKTGSISGNTINVIYEDSRENLWVGTNAGLDLLKGNQFISEAIPDIENRHISSIDEDKYGNLYISDKHGLFIHNIKNNTTRFIKNTSTYTEAIQSNYSVPVLVDSKDNKWIGSWDGLKLLQANNTFVAFETLLQSQLGTKTEVRQIFEDSKGYIWVGTRTGLYRYNPKNNTLRLFQKNENNPLSLSHNSIYSIYEDNTGIIWIGTWGGGVNILTDKLLKFEHYHHQSFNPNSLSNNVVSAFEEDNNGIWIGTELGGLNFLKNGTKQFIHYQHKENNPNSLNSNHIKALFHDSKGRLWVGTFAGGLNLLDKNTKTFTQFIPQEKIFSIIEDIDGTLWIGSLHGLYRFNYELNTWKHYTHSPLDNTSLSHNFITCLLLDSDNTIWIGTKEAGLMKYNVKADNFIRYNYTKKDSLSLPSNYIISIIENKNKELIIGTNNGLCKYDKNNNNNFKKIPVKGIPDRNINGILCDNESNYWLSTYGGITKLAPDGSVINYDVNDGLQSKEFNRSAYFKSKSGKFYFGGINGFNAFIPDTIPTNQEVPKIIITDFKISNKSVKPYDKDAPLTKPIYETKKIVLHYNQTDFSFNYVAVNYYDPENNQYMYMLEGYNDSWIFAGNNRVATYTNLDAGEYTFRVKAANSDGVWNEIGASIEIVVTPPFWKTWWFISSCILLIVAIYLYRIRSIRQHNIILEQTIEERTHEIKEKNEEITAQNEELENHRNNLAQLVEDRTQKLKKALKKAKESDELKSAFLANMSHEIRTPMNAISGFSSLLNETDLSIKERAEYVDIIQANTDTLIRIIDEIIDLSLIESDQLKLTDDSFELNTMIDHLYSFYYLNNSRPNLKIKVNNELQHKNLVLHSDSIRIKQIITNLLDNARKFTDEGYIELGAKTDNELLIIYVKDSGRGIPQSELQHIFMQFTKVEEGDFSWKQGMGIGLAISKKIAKALGANLTVESTEGVGSTFSFCMPISKIISEDEMQIPEIEEPTHNNWKDKTILIAEDVQANFLYLQKVLKNTQTNIIWAKTGKEALDIVISNSNIDLILMDIKMPVMNGYEAAQKIKAYDPTLTIVAQTAYSRPEERAKFQNENFDEYLSKPINRLNLIKILEKYL